MNRDKVFIFCLIFLLLGEFTLPHFVSSISPGVIQVSDVDGSPSGWVPKIRFPNGSVDISSGVATISFPSGAAHDAVTLDTETAAIFGLSTQQLTLDSQTANYIFAAPNGSAGTPTFRAMVAADVPTLNQNTTGSAAGLSGTPSIAVDVLTYNTVQATAADGGRYSEIPNTVALTSTPTLGRIAWLNDRFWIANGTNWTSRNIVDSSMLGTGVGTMLAIAPGSEGGPTTTIEVGTSALGTAGIASGACATAVTTAATNAATTDVINWGFNGDPTGVTGYAPTANGMLTIIAYPTSGNVNFKVCNLTAAAITPGAITLNWRIQR